MYKGPLHYLGSAPGGCKTTGVAFKHIGMEHHVVAQELAQMAKPCTIVLYGVIAGQSVLRQNTMLLHGLSLSHKSHTRYALMPCVEQGIQDQSLVS